MRRRELVIGAGCVAALATAEWLRPRQALSLMRGAKLDAIVPQRFGRWSVDHGGEIVVPRTPGSLADTLYADTLTRTYRAADGGPPVMLLIAHGDSQSDLLQLHRPESCYPAVGFTISERGGDAIPIAPGVSVPGIRMNARAPGRSEDVVYWTRLGEYLPTSAGEQRRDRLRTAMQGFVADGVLVRASDLRDGEPGFDRLNGFLADLLRGMAPDHRAALIGTARARATG